MFTDLLVQLFVQSDFREDYIVSMILFRRFERRMVEDVAVGPTPLFFAESLQELPAFRAHQSYQFDP